VERGVLQPHLELVHLAVELLRREAERVLMVQLVDDAREGGLQIARVGQLEVAAAGLTGELRQSRIGPVPAAAAGAAATRPAAPAAAPAAVSTDAMRGAEPR